MSVKVRDILRELEQIAPQRYAFSFDKVGLQVGDPEQIVTKAVVSLDRSLGCVNYAVASEAQMVIAHHPLIFTPLATVTTATHTGKTALLLAQNKIAFCAAHTNWDSALGGVNDALADLLNLHEVEAFGTASDVEQFRFRIILPAEAAGPALNEFQEFGATSVESADSQGQTIFHGSIRAESSRALDSLAKRFGASNREYQVLKPTAEQPAGRVGRLAHPLTLEEFASHVEKQLSCRCEIWGDPGKKVKGVAVVGGAADSEWMNAQRAKADVLVTGEVKQHIAVEASESGMCVIAAGHYATEQPGVAALANRLASAVPEVEFNCFQPEPGFSGRPLYL